MKLNMKKHIIACMVFCCISVHIDLMAHHSHNSIASSNINQVQDKLTYKIIPAASRTWGYDIYSNGKKLIHQPNKPGVSGNKGFRTKKMAHLVAQKIIDKIRKGEMPPSMSQEELDLLGVE
jgi:hypothetical protein